MWPNPKETADLVTFTEEILNGKLHFLCSVSLTHYYCEGLRVQKIVLRKVKFKEQPTTRDVSRTLSNI